MKLKVLEDRILTVMGVIGIVIYLCYKGIRQLCGLEKKRRNEKT